MPNFDWLLGGESYVEWTDWRRIIWSGALCCDCRRKDILDSYGPVADATYRCAQEIVWSRLIFVLASIEAVAFGAAGAIFGTQIQRQRVAEARERADKAEQRAHKAEEEAASNKENAVKGETLALAIKADAESRGGGGEGTQRLSAGGDRGDNLVALANKLFPG